MAMAWRSKGYQYTRRVLQRSLVPTSFRNAFRGQNDIAELGLQAQRMLGRTHVTSSLENGNDAVETSLGSGERMISVSFIDKHGDEKSIKVPLGTSMLEAAHQNDIELEGACEGSLACSTCHVIVMDEKYYNKLSEPTDEENDMLDLAFGLTETSRLGCQVLAKPELDGMRLAIPSATRNFAVDGYVPKPH